MNIRDLESPDLLPINDLWEKHHKGIRGIPNRNLIVTDAIVENAGIIGYGMVKLFGEALLYLNRDYSKFQQTKALKLLMQRAINQSKLLGLDQLHVGTDDKDFCELLESHYGFSDRGKVISLELKDGKS